MDRAAPEGTFTLRIAPAAQAALQQSGLGPLEAQRVYERLAQALSASGSLTSLPRWPARTSSRSSSSLAGSKK